MTNDKYAGEYSNMDCFNAASASLLAELHSHFPHPLTLSASEFQQQLVDTHRLPQQCDYQPRLAAQGNLVATTLNYLTAEGLIRCREIYNNNKYSDVVLTSRGLSALNQPAEAPAEAGSAPTVGQQLESIKQHTLKSTISSAVSSVFNYIAS